MILELVFFVVFISTSFAGYSKVFQGVEHGIYMGEYCQKNKYCPEGTHVVCMHNPDVNEGRGPSCYSPVNLVVSEQLIEEILSITNSIRRNIAKGIETGKDGVKLPSGFGIWRLKWDDELAMFAQVLANQCTLKHDLCRATQTFHDPGQTVGIMRFEYPSWKPIKAVQASIMDKPINGFSDELVEYAVLNIIKKWYKQKKNVSPQHIEELKWDSIIGSYEGTLYLQLIHGFSTHMGCGVSAYTDYIFNVNNADLIYNVILLVCNFAGRPSSNGPVYQLSRNEAVPTSPQGCPTNSSTEDEDGLCNALPKTKSQVLPLAASLDPSDNCKDEDCKKNDPPVILMPIFTVEDGYPTYKKQKYTRKSANNTEDDFGENYPITEGHSTRRHNSKKNIIIIDRSNPLNKRERFITDQEYEEIPNDIHRYNISNKYNNKQILKQRPNIPLRTIKGNVDDTSLDRQLIDVNDKCAGKQCNEMDVYNLSNMKTPILSAESFPKKEIDVYTENPVEYDDMETYTVSYSNNNKQQKTEESDRKLMRILDYLQQEVKHINLDNEEKELINLKIRKIYSILGNNLYKSSGQETNTNSITQNRDYPVHTFNSKPKSQRFGIRRSMPNRLTKYLKQKLNKDVIGPKKNIERPIYKGVPTESNINNQEYAYFGRNFHENQMAKDIKNRMVEVDHEKRAKIKNRQNYLFSRPMKSEKRTNARRSKPKDGYLEAAVYK